MCPRPGLGPELRHRCHGCSLLTVCQPEETLYQLRVREAPADAAPPAGITRVIPQSDDGAVVYLQEPGSHVGRRSSHLTSTRWNGMSSLSMDMRSAAAMPLR